MFHDDYEYVDVPRGCIESVLLMCPLCSDTKSVRRPPQTIILTPNPPYRTECDNCEIWWETRKEFD